MINYYELLEKIKEGNPPEEVMFNCSTYKWNGSCYYSEEEVEESRYLSKCFVEYEMFNEYCIKVVGEPNTIEKLTLKDEPILYGSIERWLGTYVTTKERKICCAIETLSIKINEIIEVLNEKEEIQDNQE